MLVNPLDAMVGLPQRLHAALRAAGEDLRELRLTGERLDRRVARIEAELSEFNGRLDRIEQLVSRLAEDVDEATDRLPGDDKGPLGKAREVLTSAD